MKKNQSGFSTIEAVLIVVIVMVIAGVGWFVYDSQKKTNDTLAKTAQSQGESQKAEKKTAEPTSSQTKLPEATTANHLDIKEWGVKLMLEDEAKITYTTPKKCYDDPTDQSYCIELKLKPSVTPIEECQSLGVGVTRGPVGKTNGPGKLYSNVNGYDYILGGGPGACDKVPPQGDINTLRAKITGSEFSLENVLRPL